MYETAGLDAKAIVAAGLVRAGARKRSRRGNRLIPAGRGARRYFLVSHGYAATRSEAQAAIRAGQVHADGRKIIKPRRTIARRNEHQVQAPRILMFRAAA